MTQPLMTVGQIVKIKPEWLGPKEDPDALYVVRTPDEPSKPRVDISAIEDIDRPFWGMELAQTDMLILTNIQLDMGV
ncbi:MAG TPA: hypothetical protein VJM79_10080 [Rhizorhapis sp.]|nr:hypothetical protein [Rhizorhapis sp.]